MEISYLFKGLIVGISVSAPLGPIGILCIQRIMNKGYVTGLISGLGAAIADLLYAIVAGFGITIVANFLVEFKGELRLGGSLFLVFLGARIFFSNPILQIRRQRRKRQNLLKDFISVFFLTLTNPLTIIVFGAVYAGLGLVDYKSGLSSTVLLTIGIFIGAMIWWSLISFGVNSFKDKIRLRSLLWINKITGVVIAVFGLAIAVNAIYILFFNPEIMQEVSNFLNLPDKIL